MYLRIADRQRVDREGHNARKAIAILGCDPAGFADCSGRGCMGMPVLAQTLPYQIARDEPGHRELRQQPLPRVGVAVEGFRTSCRTSTSRGRASTSTPRAPTRCSSTNARKRIARNLGLKEPPHEGEALPRLPYATIRRRRRRGERFKLTDGVSCEACHGPAEPWIEIARRPERDARGQRRPRPVSHQRARGAGAAVPRRATSATRTSSSPTA